MQRHLDKESGKDGVTTSASLSNRAGCAGWLDLDLDQEFEVFNRYAVLRHISYGYERPTSGVTAPNLNAVTT